MLSSTLVYYSVAVVNAAAVNLAPAFEGDCEQGCQMVCFRTKDTNLGKFWRALELKTQVDFMIIWNILQPFGLF
jgi:hypothetical protein